MGKVYSVGKDKTNSKTLLATKDYVDGMAKQLTGFLVNHNNDTRAHDSLIKRTELPIDESFTVEDLPLKIERIEVNNSNGVNLTPDELLNLKNRPTGIEVSQLIANATDRAKKEFEESVNKILNSKNSFNKLKDLMTILNTEDATQLLNKVLETRLSKGDLEVHSRSKSHITENERAALNLLLELFKNGIDWETEGGIGYIKNKPLALPANGGNADTVGGFTPEELVNKSVHDLIIGVEGANYPTSMVDIYVESDNSNYSYIKTKIEDFGFGNIFFRNGVYRLNEINLARGRHSSNADVLLSGNKNNSIIYDTNCIFNQKITIRDLCFENCNITIESGVTIEYCEFVNCSIIFTGNANIFNYNFLNNCRVGNNGVCMGNIITYNRIINGEPILYIGPNNLIQSNISL